jgi:hypothetical protein
MIKRPTQLDVPERYPYMLVTLPDKGEHHLQIPSLLAVAKLVKVLKRSHLAVFAGMSGGVSSAGILNLIKESGPEMAGALGALLGLSWRHEAFELEAARGSDDELLAYGEAVYEELHAAGYTLSDLAGLSLTVARAVWEQAQLSDEVQVQAAFIFPMLGKIRSPASTSGSTTLATPLASES